MAPLVCAYVYMRECGVWDVVFVGVYKCDVFCGVTSVMCFVGVCWCAVVNHLCFQMFTLSWRRS